MARAAKRREIGFDLMHLRPQDELAMAEHARDRIVDGLAKPATLGGHVNKRNWTVVHSDLLIHEMAARRDVNRSPNAARAGPTAVTAFAAGSEWRFRGRRRPPRR